MRGRPAAVRRAGRRTRHIRQIAFIGDYPPRQCGIAAFTADLCEAVADEFPDVDCFAVAVTDREEGYDYPPRVRFEIPEENIAAYRRAAEFLNTNNVDRVCVQHEYGIYGGPEGSHLLALLRELHMPVVTTLHTILREPNPEQRRVMEELARLSDRLVTLSRKGAEFLREVYGVPAEKIDHIPHGIPDMPFIDPNFYKDQFGVEGRMVLLTFGLLSRNKGVEYAIEALPQVIERHREVAYIVLGPTHPSVVRHEGEVYRRMLEERVQKLGLEEHVIFDDRFVSLEELIAYIGAADIYITPYIGKEQISSGTLSYALGAGKAILSTPYWYAEELLADGRGVLVPFRDSQAIADAVNELLENETKRHQMRKRAYLFGREMIWPRVAQRYIDSFQKAWEERLRAPHFVWTAEPAEVKGRALDLPPLRLGHLLRLTDGTGIFQHAVFTVPNYREGYTTDDNARALIVAVLLEALGEDGATRSARELAARYMAFLWYAFEPNVGRFRNFLGYDRRWLEDVGSEDSHGRALWALGTVMGLSNRKGLRGMAGRLFDQALPAVRGFTSARAWGFSILGVHEYLQEFPGSRTALQACKDLAERLLALYEHSNAPDWPWFEDVVSYDNATLPHALLLAGEVLKDQEMIDIGLKTLGWLADVQRADAGHFVPIGNSGFYPRGGERARFDQQPIEAHSMVSACLAAFRLTGEERWHEEARRAFEWFLGRNDLGLPLYDAASGGCHDGLQPDGVNENQGAESTLAFLLSLLEIKRLAHLRGRPIDSVGSSGS
jgi:glycosyltransferase involved in cell wall biosynthesis